MLAEQGPAPELAGQTIDAVTNTEWYTEPEPVTGGSLLAFQHPNFGPVGLLIPRDQVAYLVDLLTQQLHGPAGQSKALN